MLLSLILAVTAVSVIGVFVTPKAEAITSQTAGSYYIKVVLHDEMSTVSDLDSCNNSGGYLVVPTRKQDGSAGTTWYATVKSGEWDSDNMTATYYYGANGKNQDASINVAVNGFPTQVISAEQNSTDPSSYIKNKNSAWASKITFKIYVSPDNSTWTEVMSYTERTSKGGRWSDTKSVNSSKYPALNSVGISGATTVLTHGSATQTYTVTSAVDQYNVAWGFSSVTWASSNSNTSITSAGKATFGYNSGTAYATVLTPSLYNGSYLSKDSVAVSVNPVADTISLHETKTASINSGNGHFFCFKPTASGKYVFWAGGTDLDPLGIIFDAGCNELKRQDDISNSSNGNPTAQSVLGLSSGNRHYVVYSFTANTEYFLFTNDYYNVNNNYTKTGSYPVTVSRAVTLNFNDANTGAVTTFTEMPSNQPFVIADRVSYTRSNHTLIAWSNSGSGAETKTIMHSETLTIPSNANTVTYYALWYPGSPATVSPNNDYTATITAGGQIQFYQFTPSASKKYVIYGKSDEDTFINRYNASTYQSNGTYIDVQDDSGNTSNGNLTGYEFDGMGSSDFFMLREFTAGTRYLLGVKYYGSSDTGDIPFRIEEVYNVSYNLRGGTRPRRRVRSTRGSSRAACSSS